MQTSILWTGREYYSLENCLVRTTSDGNEINSVIVGKYEEKIYHVKYHIKTNQRWETLFLELTYQHSILEQHLVLESDGKGNWSRNDQDVEEFNGCIDVDIPLTPFTNTLPINRLQLKQGETLQIQVIYLDLLANEIKPGRQLYNRLSAKEYLYQNIPNDFEAKIKVDEQGLVVDYPSLFVMTAKQNASYPGIGL